MEAFLTRCTAFQSDFSFAELEARSARTLEDGQVCQHQIQQVSSWYTMNLLNVLATKCSDGERRWCGVSRDTLHDAVLSSSLRRGVADT